MKALYLAELAILGLSLFNLVKIAISLIANEIFDLRKQTNQADNTAKYQPLISIIIPAYNEEVCIERTLRAVLVNDYSKVEIIVVDDGSTDATSQRVDQFRQQTAQTITLLTQANQGKSVAISHAVKSAAHGELVMVLDADSQLAPTAVSKMVAHFQDNRILAMAANVKMLPLASWLGMIQRYEFISAYRGKCAEDCLHNLYIIGGIGSTFRRNAMLSIGVYDTDTLTEDIDFTMKLITRFGNRKWRLGYAADVVVHTEPVQRFKSLMRQRFRWKYGRFTAFLKYRQLFFSCQPQYSKMLCWYTLPNALLQEVFMLVEPLLFIYVQVILIYFGEWTTYVTMMAFFGVLLGLALWGDVTESRSTKVKLLLVSPVAYFGLFTLTLVDFFALIKSICQARVLLSRTKQEARWKHVERM